MSDLGFDIVDLLVWLKIVGSYSSKFPPYLIILSKSELEIKGGRGERERETLAGKSLRFNIHP